MHRFLIRNKKLFKSGIKLQQLKSTGIASFLPKQQSIFQKQQFPFCTNNNPSTNNNPTEDPPCNNIPPNDDPTNNSPHKLIYKRDRLTRIELKEQHLPLTAEENKQEKKTYMLVNDIQPLIPFEKNKLLHFQKVIPEMIEHPLLFIPIKENTIFTVGLVLSKKVSQALRKIKEYQESSSTSSTDNYIKKTQLIVEYNHNLAVVLMASKQRNYRVSLTSITPIPNTTAFTVQAIYYNDGPKSAYLLKHSLDNEINKIKNLVANVKLQNEYEKIEAFSEINVQQTNIKKLDKADLEVFYYKLVEGIIKIGKYLKEDTTEFLQNIIESESQIERFYVVRKKLESIWNIFSIVNKSYTEVTNQQQSYNFRMKAKMVMDHIQNNYKLKEPSNNKVQMNESRSAIEKYRNTLELITDESSREKVRKELERFEQMDKQSGEYYKIQQYLDDVSSVPWNSYSPAYYDKTYTQSVLDQQVYGLPKVKERILEMISVNKVKKASERGKGFIILLYGPPGTGKTSIARSIAHSLRRPSRFISFSGVSDSHFIKGHRRTYVDSQPGVFVKELQKSGCMNPVFIVDEIDKLQRTGQGGDPYYSLLEILNPEENKEFTDHYLDIKVDFSQAIFILTANEVMHMLEPLRNRLEIISIPSYTIQEKLSIAHQYLTKKVWNDHGLNQHSINISDDVMINIIKGYCYYEGGVRELRRSLQKIARKYVAQQLTLFNQQQTVIDVKQEVEDKVDKNTDKDQGYINKNVEQNTERLKKPKERYEEEQLENKEENKEEPKEEIKKPLKTDNQFALYLQQCPPLSLTNLEAKQMLGAQVFDPSDEERSSSKAFLPGQCNILATAGFSGSVMMVECVYDQLGEQTGSLKATGNLQTVLQESLQLAKMNAFRLLSQTELQTIRNKNVRVHFLDASSQKDGPSAGTAETLALLSLYKNTVIDSRLAMTGEISLNGDVCQIGGVQAKVTAAKTLNIDKLILPYSNLGEVLDISPLLLQDLTLYFVLNFSQIYQLVINHKMTDPEYCQSMVIIQNGHFLDQKNYLPQQIQYHQLHN